MNPRVQIRIEALFAGQNEFLRAGRSLRALSAETSATARVMDRFTRMTTGSLRSMAGFLSKQVGNVFRSFFFGIRIYAIMAGAAVSGFVGSSIRAFMDFDKKLRQTTALIAGAQVNVPSNKGSLRKRLQESRRVAEAEYKAYSRAITRMSVPTSTRPTELAGGLTNVVSAGFSGRGPRVRRQATALLNTAAKGARAGGGTTDQATTMLIQTINALGLKPGGMKGGVGLNMRGNLSVGRIMDRIFQAMNFGVNVTFQDMATALGYGVGPLGAAVGGKGGKQGGRALNEMLAAIIATSQQGLNPIKTMQGLTQVIAKIRNPTKSGEEFLAQLGLKGGTGPGSLLEKGLIGPGGALPRLEQALRKQGFSGDKLTEGLGKIFKDARAERVLSSLFNTGMKNVRSLIGLVEESKGAYTAAFDQYQQSIQGITDKFNAFFEVVKIGIGRMLAPTVVSALEKFSGLLDKVTGGQRGAALFDQYDAAKRRNRGLTPEIFGVDLTRADREKFMRAFEFETGGFKANAKKLITDAGRAVVNYFKSESTQKMLSDTFYRALDYAIGLLGRAVGSLDSVYRFGLNLGASIAEGIKNSLVKSLSDAGGITGLLTGGRGGLLDGVGPGGRIIAALLGGLVMSGGQSRFAAGSSPLSRVGRAGFATAGGFLAGMPMELLPLLMAGGAMQRGPLDPMGYLRRRRGGIAASPFPGVPHLGGATTPRDAAIERMMRARQPALAAMGFDVNAMDTGVMHGPMGPGRGYRAAAPARRLFGGIGRLMDRAIASSFGTMTPALSPQALGTRTRDGFASSPVPGPDPSRVTTLNGRLYHLTDSGKAGRALSSTERARYERDQAARAAGRPTFRTNIGGNLLQRLSRSIMIAEGIAAAGGAGAASSLGYESYYDRRRGYRPVAGDELARRVRNRHVLRVVPGETLSGRDAAMLDRIRLSGQKFAVKAIETFNQGLTSSIVAMGKGGGRGLRGLRSMTRLLGRTGAKMIKRMGGASGAGMLAIPFAMSATQALNAQSKDERNRALYGMGGMIAGGVGGAILGGPMGAMIGGTAGAIIVDGLVNFFKQRDAEQEAKERAKKAERFGGGIEQMIGARRGMFDVIRTNRGAPTRDGKVRAIAAAQTLNVMTADIPRYLEAVAGQIADPQNKSGQKPVTLNLPAIQKGALAIAVGDLMDAKNQQQANTAYGRITDIAQANRLGEAHTSLLAEIYTVKSNNLAAEKIAKEYGSGKPKIPKGVDRKLMAQLGLDFTMTGLIGAQYSQGPYPTGAVPQTKGYYTPSGKFMPSQAGRPTATGAAGRYAAMIGKLSDAELGRRGYRLNVSGPVSGATGFPVVPGDYANTTAGGANALSVFQGAPFVDQILRQLPSGAVDRLPGPFTQGVQDLGATVPTAFGEGFHKGTQEVIKPNGVIETSLNMQFQALTSYYEKLFLGKFAGTVQTPPPPGGGATIDASGAQGSGPRGGRRGGVNQLLSLSGRDGGPDDPSGSPFASIGANTAEKIATTVTERLVKQHMPRAAKGNIARGIGWLRAQVGKPYVWGGGHPANLNLDGYDCSGLASSAMLAMGLGVQGTTYQLVNGINPNTVGPVVLGFNRKNRPSHMGIAVAGQWFEARGRGTPILGPGQARESWPYYGVPKYHTGGVYRAPRPGGEGLALLRDGERVVPTATPRTGGTGGGDITINIAHAEIRSDQDIKRVAAELHSMLAVRRANSGRSY